MKKTVAQVALNVIAVMLCSAAMLHFAARAQGIGPYIGLSAVATGQSCPTPVYTGTQMQGDLCTDGKNLYFSSVVTPTPALLSAAAGAAILAQGTVTAGNLMVWVDPTHAKDGGPVPAVPGSIVTAPVTIPVGHLMIAGSTPGMAVDGGSVPSVPALSKVATSGQYTDLLNPPTLPNFANSLLNCASYSESSTSGLSGTGCSLH